jgi:ketosteroid isomerase-like protein
MVVFTITLPAFGQNTGAKKAKQKDVSTSADSTATKEIKEILYHDVQQALSLSSATAQDQIAHFEQDYAKNYISVAVNGRAYTRDDIISEMKKNGSNNQKYDSVTMNDVQIHIYGNTAVATYIMHYTGKREEKPFRRSVRESAVFNKQNGQWLRILEQRSLLMQ